MDDEKEESCSAMGGSCPDLVVEWRNWRVDDLGPESDEAAEEGVKKKRKKFWERVDGYEVSTNLVHS